MEAQVARQRLPRAEREEQLLSVAHQVFSERGFRAPSMDEIALRAGVSKPILYDHFGSKDGLVAASIRRAGVELFADIAAAVQETTDPRATLEAGFTAFFEYIESRGQGWFMLIGENSLVGPAADELESIRRQEAAFVADRLVMEMPDRTRDDVETFAEAIIGACERIALWRRERPGTTVAAATSSLMTLVWSGLSSLVDGVAPPA